MQAAFKQAVVNALFRFGKEKFDDPDVLACRPDPESTRRIRWPCVVVMSPGGAVVGSSAWFCS